MQIHAYKNGSPTNLRGKYVQKTHIINSYLQQFQLIGMEAATPAESARNEDPGLSLAKEAAEVVPAESVRCNGNQQLLFI